VPGYLKKSSELKGKGVDAVIIFCVNDGAVMQAWEKDQKVPADDLVKFYADPSSDLTQKLGLVLDHEGPMGVLGNKRCKRFSALIEDGVFKKVFISAKDNDPAGDDDPSLSCVENMLTNL
jgi:2-Cys peroxiredoxin 5